MPCCCACWFRNLMGCTCLHAQEAAKVAGYHSPTSRDSPEKIHASPSEEWHSESLPRKSLSPATKKRFHEELEDDIDALSSHSSDSEVWDPNGKTQEEIAAWYAEYKRCNRRQGPSASAWGMQVYGVRTYHITFTDLLPSAIREEATAMHRAW